MPYVSDAQRKAVWASKNERGEGSAVKMMMSPLSLKKGRKNNPYKKLTDRFPQFNQATDTIISGSSRDPNMASKIARFNAGNAALSLAGKNRGNVSLIKSPPKAQKTTQNTSTGEYNYYRLYDKNKLKEAATSPINKVRKTEKGASLKRWFKEEWIDVRTGKPCGRTKGDGRGVPYCRPKKRISSKTPKTASEMSSAEKKKKIAEKKRLGQPAGKPRRVKSVKRRR